MRNRVTSLPLSVVAFAPLMLGACEPDERFDPNVETLSRPVDISCAADGRVFVADSSSIVDLDLESGSMRAIALLDLFGSGPPLANPRALALSMSGTHGYVISQPFPRAGSSDEKHLIMRIDLRTGDRTELARVGSREHVSLDRITDMLVTPDDARLLIAVEELGVVAFDLESRELSVVYDSGAASKTEGLMLSGPRELWVAQIGGSELVLLDAHSGQVLREVSLAPTHITPVGIRSGKDAGQALVLASGAEAGLWNVDLETGDAAMFPNAAPLGTPAGFCVNHDEDYALVIDRSAHEPDKDYVLWAIGLTSGDFRDILRW